MGFNNPDVSVDVFPYLRVYKDGTIERIAGTEVVPAGHDSETDVLSKDIVILPGTGVSARVYRPNFVHKEQKLPLVVYFHGGAFCIATAAEPKYHTSLNKLVAESNVVVLSVDYRLAPEHPLPVAYEDSWAALQWVASHVVGEGGQENWLKDHVDFEQVFLAGDRLLVIVAEKDILRDRGKLYYEKLVKSGWQGTAELMETEGEDHVFHIFEPNSVKAKGMTKRLASFFNKGKAPVL